MPTYALTGDDTLIINDRPITDLTDNDVTNIDIPNDVVSVSTGKNQNTIFAKNEAGNNVNLTARILMNSSDDKFLNGLFNNQDNNFAGFSLMNGSFVKKVGDGAGKISYNTYTLLGGMFLRKSPVKSNVNGDTEQGTMEYNLVFALASRAIV